MKKKTYIGKTERLKGMQIDKLENHKQVKCPICRKRLLDSGYGIETYVAPGSEVREADFYTKCWGCGVEIGIKKIT